MSYVETLYKIMEEQLEDAALCGENRLQKAERSLQVTRTAFFQLKDHILQEGFANQASEIYFFKVIKPKFLKQMLFFSELFTFEEKRPLGTKDELVSYYHQAIGRARLYATNHQAIYTYYQLGRTDQDSLYFLRSSISAQDNPEFDQRFCTAVSSQLGKLLALETLVVQLLGELHTIEYGPMIVPALSKDRPKLAWTDSKASFIELVYALQTSGSINNGKTSVAQLVSALAEIIQIDAGNYYAVFQQNIRIRKKRRTVYLDHLIKTLEERMNECDKNPRY